MTEGFLQPKGKFKKNGCKNTRGKSRLAPKDCEGDLNKNVKKICVAPHIFSG